MAIFALSFHIINNSNNRIAKSGFIIIIPLSVNIIISFLLGIPKMIITIIYLIISKIFAIKPFLVTGKGFHVARKGFTVTGKCFTVKGNCFIVAGKGFIVTGKDFTVAGKGFTVAGKGFTGTGKGFIVAGKGFIANTLGFMKKVMVIPFQKIPVIGNEMASINKRIAFISIRNWIIIDKIIKPWNKIVITIQNMEITVFGIGKTYEMKVI
jgi:hypothetical protein